MASTHPWNKPAGSSGADLPWKSRRPGLYLRGLAPSLDALPWDCAGGWTSTMFSEETVFQASCVRWSNHAKLAHTTIDSEWKRDAEELAASISVKEPETTESLVSGHVESSSSVILSGSISCWYWRRLLRSRTMALCTMSKSMCSLISLICPRRVFNWSWNKYESFN